MRLSPEAKSAIVWLCFSGAADKLTVKEARENISKIFGQEIAQELELFFKEQAVRLHDLEPG